MMLLETGQFIGLLALTPVTSAHSAELELFLLSKVSRQLLDIVVFVVFCLG